MKHISILAALAVSSPAFAQAGKPMPRPTAALPNFTYKTVAAGEAINTDAFKCDPPGETGEILCKDSDKVLAGTTSLLGTYYYLYQGKLTSLTYITDADNFPTILAALTAKYGKPCSVTSPKWQSRAGATFDNDVVDWCFRSGKLTFTRMSSDRTYSDLTYTDNWQAPASKPKVDF